MKRLLTKSAYKPNSLHVRHRIVSLHKLSRYSEATNENIPNKPDNRNFAYFATAVIAAGGVGVYGFYQYNSNEMEQEKEVPVEEDIFASYYASLPVKEVKESDILGEISLSELNKYDYKHATRQLICVYGTIFDVSDEKDKYGVNGSYKHFAGHDITLALGSGSLNRKYLDHFVQMDQEYTKDAKEWLEFYKKKYPVVGSLKNWNEDQTNWPQLTAQQKQELTLQIVPINQ